MFVTVSAQFTAKMTNSKKALYFLLFMSYSINKAKPHMLLDFIFKKIDPENGKMVEGRGLPSCSQCLWPCFNTGSSHFLVKKLMQAIPLVDMWVVSKVESLALILLVSFSGTCDFYFRKCL